LARSRPRRALRPPLAVRVGRVVAPIAFTGILASGVAVAIWPQPEYTAAVPAPVATPTETPTGSASARTSRKEASRPPVKSAASAKAFRAKPSAKEKPPTFAPSTTAARAAAKSVSLRATGVRYATTGVNVRTEPSVDGNVITVLSAGSKVSITSESVPGWAAILYDQQRRWVRSEYLSANKPSTSTTSAATSNGISYAPCRSGSGVESGLTPDAIRVHRAICGRFPQVTTYYGVRADSLPYHPSGRALDAMISDSTVGWQIANYVRANASRLGASEVIYSQRIWTVQRSSEGWRSMSDRGSATANHYDHVHVTVYGNSGSG
jgi:Bacterial SH3 domain